MTEDELLTNLIAKSLISPHAIEKSKGLQYLLKNVYHKNFSQFQIWGSAERVYLDLFCRIKDQLKGKQISLTLDDWTSRSNNGYCNINAYLQNNDQVKRYSLGLIKVHETDGKSLAKSIRERLGEFNIEPKYLTTDGAKNMRTMSENAGIRQQLCIVHGINLLISSLIFTKDHFAETADISENYPCDETSASKETEDLVENLDDIQVENAPVFSEFDDKLTGQISNLIKNIRSISVHLSRSTKSRNALRAYTNLSPIVDMRVRWNSTYLMISRFNRLIPSIKKAALDNKKICDKIEFLDKNKENMVLSLIQLLKPFYTATVALSNEKSTLLSADLILSQLYIDMNPRLKKKFYEKVVSRRTEISDILLYLLKETDGVPFYIQPAKEDIIDVFNYLVIKT